MPDVTSSSTARWAARRTLVQELKRADELQGIQIERGWPGDRLERESIWLGPTTGTFSVPVFHGPNYAARPVTYDDVFKIPVHIVAGAEGQSEDEAEDRLEQLYNAVERTARTNPTLSKLPGLVSALLEELIIETMAAKEGYVAFADVTLGCKSRISGGTA